MAHDVFISYSARNKETADALVAKLESNNIRCWFAPRDILPGMNWSGSIVEAIEACPIFILVFSEASNQSKHVKREVELAVETEKIILPFRIEDVTLSIHMRYFIKTQHWLDAITPPLANHLNDLVKSVNAFLRQRPQNTNAPQVSSDQPYSPNNENLVKLKTDKIQAGELVISNTIPGLEMLLIKQNDFNMGDVFGDGEYMEKPVHRVTVFDFYLGKTEITNVQFARFLEEYGGNIIKLGDYAGQPMITASPGLEGNGSYWEVVSGYENHPVVNVTWYGAFEFSKHYNLRLPTEAEWEFAARSGGKNEKWAGTNSISNSREYSWFKQNSIFDTYPVGTKKPNSLGFYDMCGNVWEWCQDWYGIYGSSSVRNPQGPPIGSTRIIRGGSCIDVPKEARTVVRRHLSPLEKSRHIGFRVAQSRVK